MSVVMKSKKLMSLWQNMQGCGRTSKAEPEVKDVLKESEESSMRSKEMQDKFKCEMCEYETCKEATLNKHGQSHCVKKHKRKETNA